jgi:hypothetical protein
MPGLAQLNFYDVSMHCGILMAMREGREGGGPVTLAFGYIRWSTYAIMKHSMARRN